MKPGVLFLGGGRRVELAQRFIELGCRVFGYETSREVPLSRVATILCGKTWNDPALPEDLYGICRQHHISAVVPLQDQAVKVLAGLDPVALAWAKPVCSPQTAAALAYDKISFGVWCELEHGEYYPSPVAGQPAVIKPRFGFGSNGVRRVEEFGWHQVNRRGEVAQLELLEPEYTADGYWNLRGEFIGCCVRERLRVAGGEVLDAEVVWDDAIEGAVFTLGTSMGLRGPACFQFRYGESEIPQVLECNARMGGGSTLSCEAGLDLVGFVVKEYVKGELVEPFEPQINHGLRLARSYRDHFFHGTTYRG